MSSSTVNGISSLLEVSQRYYEIIGGGPGETDLHHYITKGSEAITGTMMAGTFETRVADVVFGLLEILNFCENEGDVKLDSKLFEPFHRLMTVLRVASEAEEIAMVEKQIIFMFLGGLPDQIKASQQSRAQVGFYLYFIGLESLFSQAMNLDQRRVRSKVVDFIETDLSRFIARRRSGKIYRHYDDSDTENFDPSLLAVENMIIGEGDEQNLDAFKDFVSTHNYFARHYRDWKDLKKRPEFWNRIGTIASKLKRKHERIP